MDLGITAVAADVGFAERSIKPLSGSVSSIEAIT
jgi:hypothetical protein